jgi:hypothetical protein
MVIPPEFLLELRDFVEWLNLVKSNNTIDVPSKGWIYWGYRGCKRGANYT